MKHTIKEWVIATRPWSFPASVMPTIVTTAWAFAEGYNVSWWLAIAAVINIVIVHAAGNTWSDIHDYRKGVDTEETYGVKTLTSGQFCPSEIKWLSIGLQIVAVIMGLTIVCLTGLTLLWIGIAGIALSLLYPPLKYHALGDVVIIFCYAVLPMLGMTFITTGDIHWDVLWLAPPVGLITVGILHANNTRDIETDTQAGMTSFPSLTGRSFAAALYVAEVTVPYAWILALCIAGIITLPTLLVLLSLPIALKNIRMMATYKKGIEGYAYLDESTAQLQLAFSLLLAVGLVLGFYLL